MARCYLVEIGGDDNGVLGIVADKGVALEALGRGRVAHYAREKGRMEGRRLDPFAVLFRPQRMEQVVPVLILRIADERQESKFAGTIVPSAGHKLDRRPNSNRYKWIEDLLWEIKRERK